MYPIFLILLPYPMIYNASSSYTNYRVAGSNVSPAEPVFIPEVQYEYQPMALFPVQMLPYQYYQIFNGKFLIPSAYFLYNFFIGPFPFSESQYKQSEFKQSLFQEKGEYSQ